MPKFVIERDIPNVGDVTPEQVIAISQKSCNCETAPAPRCCRTAANRTSAAWHARSGRHDRWGHDHSLGIDEPARKGQTK